MIPKIILNAIDEKSVQKLSPSLFREQIEAHLLKLSDADRYLRFGYSIKDEGIIKYVNNMAANDILFAIFNTKMEIVAMAHFAQLDDGSAELGLSVNEEYRGRKFGFKLFSRAILTAKVLGINEIFVQCLAENKAMQHIAKKFDMHVVSQFGESEGRLTLNDASPSDLLQYALTQQLTLYDYTIKSQISAALEMKNILMGKYYGNGA
jgi:RimJ/RimL family protein N-acetyltransferase